VLGETEGLTIYSFAIRGFDSGPLERSVLLVAIRLLRKNTAHKQQQRHQYINKRRNTNEGMNIRGDFERL
jgi:hypothetical protein